MKPSRLTSSVFAVWTMATTNPLVSNREPVCYKCKLKGHMVVDCGNNNKKIQLFSFGIPGQGFYAMEFPEEQMKKEQIVGLVKD